MRVEEGVGGGLRIGRDGGARGRGGGMAVCGCPTRTSLI